MPAGRAGARRAEWRPAVESSQSRRPFWPPGPTERRGAAAGLANLGALP